MRLKKHAPRTPKAAALWLAALCLLACLPTPSRPAANSSGREARLRVFDEVWEQVRARYFDPKLHGVDWLEVRREMRPQAEAAGSVEELYAVLRRMLASLRDPHTRVFAPGEGADWRVRRFVTVGVSVRESEGAVVVADVERESAAARAGVRAGDEVLSVAGESVSSLLAQKLAERPAANPSSARRLALARLFEGPPETDVEVAFRRAGEARARTARLRRVEAVRSPSFEARLASGRVGVVRFNIFTQEMAPRLAR
ncbi:MAG TPA: PDZ domain-containing protein, partial [Pyrinomonadaceae bacterium]|nr:PDZ domain-containing protein [Pyrinomonadaceae bacterium]